jgi:glycosyltransferase involved in cell wall biosynthesis
MTALQKPLVSVCISTRNRGHLMPRLIEALEAQTLGNNEFEAIIVDDGSTDDTFLTLKKMAGATRFRLTPKRNEVSCGPAAGRNSAWQAAVAPVIAFTDDDCVPSAGWLAAGLRGLKDESVVGVGRVTPDPGQRQDYRGFAQTLWIHERQVEWFATANVFYHRSDLESTGGFDEAFKRPSCEDTELGMRVLAIGRRSKLLADALVHHDVRPRTLGDLLRETSREEFIALLFARHPELRGRLAYRRLFWKKTHLQALLAVFGIGLGLARRRPIVAVALSSWWLHERICLEHPEPRPDRWLTSLPGYLLVDLTEIRTALRGSIHYRTLII